jgi:hypothetical protein
MRAKTEYFCLRDKARVNKGKVYKVCLFKPCKDEEDKKERCFNLREKTVMVGGRKK